MLKSLFSSVLRLWVAFLLLIILSSLTLENSQIWADISANNLLDCTNTIRAEKSEEPLYLNGKLQQAAKEKLEDMETYHYWAHQNPETGKMPWHFIDEQGYTYLSAGENLAIGYSIGEHVCEAWKASPTHYANLIDERFQEVGFASQQVDLGVKKGILIVQLFGNREDFTPPTLTEQLGAQILQNRSHPASIIILILILLTPALTISAIRLSKEQDGRSK